MNIIGIVHVKKFKIFPLKNDININIVTTIICNIDSKDLLLIAAALAVKNNLPYDKGLEEKMSDTISYANLNGPAYQEYRHYISAIYFSTKANKSVENMKDVTDMVRNFEDYAHRGILYLKDRYLDTKDGDEELFVNFVELLNK